MAKTAFLILPLALASTALASSALAAEPGLPDEASVATALDDHPSVAAARARVNSAHADARARAAGPHEFTFSGSYVRRTVDREGEYDEYDAQVTRAIRLPGKASLDRDIGAFGIEAAENLAEDAKHQAARMLAQAWWDWLGAAAEARIDTEATGNYRKALAAVERRVELHDASPLEAEQARAAVGSARVAAEQSTGRARLARARLAAQFPSLALPGDPPELPQPEVAEADIQRYRDLVLTNSHEIAAAEALAGRASSMAKRARRERIADPSLGVRLFSERGGMERGAGVVLSIPLGGGHRKALADQATADAGAAAAEARLAHYDVQEMADTDAAEARFRLEAWQRAREALSAQQSVLGKLRRGHELGEVDLSDLLLGERASHEAGRAETVARTEAMRAITRLRIDSHELWLTD